MVAAERTEKAKAVCLSKVKNKTLTQREPGELKAGKNLNYQFLDISASHLKKQEKNCRLMVFWPSGSVAPGFSGRGPVGKLPEMKGGQGRGPGQGP